MCLNKIRYKNMCRNPADQLEYGGFMARHHKKYFIKNIKNEFKIFTIKLRLINKTKEK